MAFARVLVVSIASKALMSAGVEMMPQQCLTACPGLAAMNQEMEALAPSDQDAGSDGNSQSMEEMMKKFDQMETMTVELFEKTCKYMDEFACMRTNSDVCTSSSDQMPEGDSSGGGSTSDSSFDPMDVDTSECFCSKCPGAAAATTKFQFFFTKQMMAAFAGMGSAFASGFSGGTTAPTPTAAPTEDPMVMLCPVVKATACMESHSVCAVQLNATKTLLGQMNQNQGNTMEAACAAYTGTPTAAPPTPPTTSAPTSSVDVNQATSFASSSIILLFFGILVSFFSPR